MATYKGYSRSIRGGSEPFYDFCCSPCSEDGKNIEASNACVECGQNLCNTCLGHHNKFSGMRSHKILDKAGMTTRGPLVSPALLTERCTIHLTEVVNMYCGAHDIVCCGVCIAKDHRLCKGVDYIPHVATGIKSSKEVKQVKDNMTKVQLDLGKMKKLKQDNLQRNELDKATNQKQIDDFREAVVKHLDDLVNKAKHEVKTKHKEIDINLNSDIQLLNDSMSTLDENSKHIEANKADSEVQLFVYVKQAKMNTVDGSKLLNKIKTTIGQEKFSLTLNNELKHYVTNLDSICDMHIEDGDSISSIPYVAVRNKPPRSSTILKAQTNIATKHSNPVSSAKLHRECNVNVKSDQKTCNIEGCCILEDGSLIITDFSNNKLKLYDREYKTVDQCKLPSSPWNICSVSQTEVAVTLKDTQTVQLVSTRDNQLSLTRSFRVDENCAGIAFSKGELFITSGEDNEAQVRVYSLAGNQLRTFQTDASRQKLFSFPRGITISNDGSCIHVADWNIGLVTLDRQGRRESKFKDIDLQGAYGVCVLPNDDVLVAGSWSNNIVHLDKNGKKKSVILTQADGIQQPRSLSYDRKLHRLVVAMGNSDTINVYDLV